MVRLPAGFCVDVTEVTVAAYRACVTASKCAAPLWKPADGNWVLGNESHPLNWVSWSEAQAFCAANGKRLCGRIGGGSPGANQMYDAAVDQWYAACSSGGFNVYTYGGTYQAGACWTGLTHAVGTASACHSPASEYAAVMDLSGNVWEWEDLCGTTSCAIRGGGNTTTPQTDLRCDFNAWRGKQWSGKEVGFRCCAD
jgi:formylglycine-generating enzyme required for sulfatase activity